MVKMSGCGLPLSTWYGMAMVMVMAGFSMVWYGMVWYGMICLPDLRVAPVHLVAKALKELPVSRHLALHVHLPRHGVAVSEDGGVRVGGDGGGTCWRWRWRWAPCWS